MSPNKSGSIFLVKILKPEEEKNIKRRGNDVLCQNGGYKRAFLCLRNRTSDPRKSHDDLSQYKHCAVLQHTPQYRLYYTILTPYCPTTRTTEQAPYCTTTRTTVQAL